MAAMSADLDYEILNVFVKYHWTGTSICEVTNKQVRVFVKLPLKRYEYSDSISKENH